MRRINILGSGADVLSMILETLCANNQIDCEVNIFQNIPNTLSHNDYLPKGIIANILTYNDLKVNEGEFLFGVMNSKIKPSVFDFFKNYLNIERADYTNLIHNRSWVASSALLKTGIYIEPLSIISPFTEIGFGVSINRNVSIGHHTKIRDFATIAPGVNIGGHSVIGEKAQVGIGSTIFDQVKIGENSIIGGGSVVVKDIPPNSVAYGNPCKVIRTIK